MVITIIVPFEMTFEPGHSMFQIICINSMIFISGCVTGCFGIYVLQRGKSHSK